MATSLLNKSRILYKGDMIAAWFYIFTGLVLATFAGILHYFTRIGDFRYLVIGLVMFAAYSIGKGIFMYFVSYSRYRFYHDRDTMSDKEIEDEIQYTSYRIEKKNNNRRRFIYTIVISTLLAFAGIFTRQKALLTGTAIPVALISGIEFGIGLLTEFRLREYYRILNKNKDGRQGNDMI